MCLTRKRRRTEPVLQDASSCIVKEASGPNGVNELPANSLVNGLPRTVLYRKEQPKGDFLQGDITDIARWVVEAQSGSSRSFDRLHRRYAALVHGVLLSRYRPAIAEELAQECFLTAFRQLHQLRQPDSFAPWLVAIARRLEPARELATADIEMHEGIDPHDPAVLADAAKVMTIIRALPEAYRETLVLRLVEGMSGPEIAATTGLHPDSVRVNLHRGMQKLRAALGLSVDSAERKGTV